MRVPTLDQNRIQNRGVSAQYRSTVTSDDFGGNDTTGAELVQAGKDVAAISAQVKAINDDLIKKQGEKELLDAERALNDFELGLNAQGGALQARGESAGGVTEAVGEQFEKLVEGLQYSDFSATAVQRLVNSRRRSVLTTVGGHERRQLEEVLVAQNEAGLEAEIERFALSPLEADGSIGGGTSLEDGTPVSREEMLVRNVHRHIVSAAELKYGDRSDWSDETKAMVEERVQGAVSKAYRVKIEALVGQGRPIQAEALFNRVKASGGFDEPDEIALEKSVQQAALGQRAQDVADSYAHLPFAQQVEKMRTIRDEKLRSEVQSKIVERHTLDKAVQALEDKALAEGAYERMYTPGSGPLTGPERRVLGARGVAAWEKANAAANAGIAQNTDNDKWVEFQFLSTQQMAEIDHQTFVSEWAPHLDEGDRDRAIAAIRSAQDAVAKASVPDRAVTDAARKKNAIVKLVGVENYGDMSDEQKQAVRQFDIILQEIDDDQELSKLSYDAKLQEAARRFIIDNDLNNDPPRPIRSLEVGDYGNDDYVLRPDLVTRRDIAGLEGAVKRLTSEGARPSLPAEGSDEYYEALAAVRILTSGDATAPVRERARQRLRELLSLNSK